PGPPDQKRSVWGLAFAPDSRLLAVASQDGVMLWDLTAAKPLWTVPIAGADVRMAFARDGARLVAASWSEGQIKMLQVKDGKEIAHALPQRPVNAVAWSPAGDAL